MDAKSKAAFINSVANGTSVPCPKCGAANRADGKFCLSCGAELSAPQSKQASEPAFKQVKKAEDSAKTSRYVEPNTVFAEGLPEWSLEPPQVMVRRH